MLRARTSAPLFFALAALWPAPAGATYSIVAADKASRQVGGAITSCVTPIVPHFPEGLGIVYGASPGHGVIAAQAYLDAPRFRGKTRAIELLSMDTDPAHILAIITSKDIDPSPEVRQYAIVDLLGRAAGYTGAGADDYKEDRQGAVGSFVYSVQGNLLTSGRVLDQAAAAFEGDGCDLADRLMRALEAGGQNGEGDRRCTGPHGIPSDNAFLQVDREGEPAGSYLKLDVLDLASQSPLPELRRQFDAWRAAHPCPAPAVVDAGASSGSAASGLGPQGTSEQPSGCCLTSGTAGRALLPPLALLVLALVAWRRRAR
ncbi:uncharacterized protein SOCE26_072980 [Sorangium cellulosum]|uniref:DUF1028 domain-containing protein n=1 Tax=Sorangium cellulosum TaxID=56 RepID=A0A2L0F2L6_SORCE|nr:DUF1028 domain-containing protein [Sorangium cellulosum]AUX45802.1 uncharacterized protein SOCE26_072980 [Sorangium cellulosum]